MKFRRFQDSLPCFSLLVLLAVALLLGGCVRDAGTTTQGGASGLQELQIVFKDPGMPEVRYLEPNVTEIQLRTKAGQWITIWSDPAGKTVRLTPDGASVGFDTAMVPPGTYTGTRLKVSTIGVEVDVNRDGDTLDENQQVVLTLDEFNSLPPVEKPTPPGTPTPPTPGTTPPTTATTQPGTPTPPIPGTPPPPETPTPPIPGTPPTPPTLPTTPTKPTPPPPPSGPGLTSKMVGATAEEKPAKPSKPAEPSPPEEPTQPPEPTRPMQVPTREEHFEPQGTGGTEPTTPYTIVGDLVYLPVYMDEKHTITLDDYIVPYGEDLWAIDFVYDGKGGSLVYDFTLHPLLPKGRQITVKVTFIGPPPEIPPKLVSLTVSPNLVIAGDTSTGTVTMELMAGTGGQVVNLKAEPPGSVDLPTNVTVPERSTSATFSITTKPVATQASVYIIADLGPSRQMAVLNVKPSAVPSLASLAVSPSTVVGGGINVIGTVTLTGPAPAGGQVVMVTSSQSTPVSFNPVVTVKAGETSASFNITTSQVSTPVTETLVASFQGVQKTARLTVTPATVLTLSALTVSPASVVNGDSSTGTVILDMPAPSGGQEVLLSPTSGFPALVPDRVMVDPGQTSASFEISTDTVSSPTNVTISATLGNTRKATQVTVYPFPDLAGLAVQPASVTGGSPAVGTVYLTGIAHSRGMTVLISGGPETALTLPWGVTIAPGEKEASFNITTMPVTSPVDVTITALFVTEPQSARLTILPQTTPVFDVAIAGLNCTWSVKTGAYNVKSDCVRINSTGTAKGPVGARLELPILAWSDDKFNCGAWTYSPGALIAVGGTCRRAETQPETTSWFVDTGGEECPTKSYFASTRTHTVKIYRNNEVTPQDTDTRTVSCTG